MLFGSSGMDKQGHIAEMGPPTSILFLGSSEMENPQALVVQGGAQVDMQNVRMLGFEQTQPLVLGEKGTSPWLPGVLGRRRDKGLIKHTALLERRVLLVFAFPGPGTWGASGHTSQDLFSSSYLYLLLNILGIKLISEENSAVTRSESWSLASYPRWPERWHPDAIPLSSSHSPSPHTMPQGSQE